MYDPQQQQQQHFVDLQDNAGFGDPDTWLSGDADNHDHRHQHRSAAASANANLDRRLFDELVEMFPLVEHLIDQKEKSSFKRRGSMVYTKTPSREALSRKIPDPRGRNASQSIPARKKRDPSGNDDGKTANGEQDTDNIILSSRALAAEREEVDSLREQVADLQRKLLEKDELLKSMEMSKIQVNEVHAKLDEMKQLAAEKESLFKSIQLQLSDAKIKLADKQAALEKTQWEAMTSSTKAEKLQEQLDNVQGEISSFVQLFEGSRKNSPRNHNRDYDVTPYQFNHVPYLDDLDETDTQKMEEAKAAYIAAVAIAKQRQDEESLAAAARARCYLQSFVFKSQSINTSKVGTL